MAEAKGRVAGVSVVIATAMLGAGCERGHTWETKVQRDSAGVLIVETHEPRWRSESPWRIGETPAVDLSVSGSGAAHEFHHVSDATRLADGSIVVADQGSNEVRLFSSTGDFLGAAGGHGEGPGEFERLTSVHEASEGSIIAFDFWLGRLTRFSRGLSVIETRRPYDPNVRVQELHFNDDDSMAGVTWSRGALTGVLGRYRMPYTIVRFTLDRMDLDTIATIGGFEGYRYEEGDMRPLFPRSGHVAVHQGRLYLGEADSLEVRVHDLKGALIQVMRVPGFGLRVTSEEVRAERESMMSERTPERIRDVIMEMPAPESTAAYSALFVDADGFVWAPEALRFLQTGPVKTQIFAPDGEWLGTIALPDRLTVFEIGSDYVLGVWRDEFDVESVQLLGLERHAY